MGKKGDGTLYKHKGLYYFQIQVNGKRKTIPLKTGIEAEALREAEAKRQLFSSTSIDHLAVYVADAKKMIAPSIELAHVWEKYLASPSRPDSGKRTLEGYDTQWKTFSEWLKDFHANIKTLAEINADIAASYASHLWDDRNLSSSTYNQHIKTLRLITRIVGKGSLVANPWEDVKLKTEIKQKRLDFTPEDIEKILDWFNSATPLKDKEEMRTLFYLGAHTGLRLESAINLTWENVDLRNERIVCTPSKTARIARTVKIPLTPDLKTALLKLPSRTGNLIPNLKTRYSSKSHGCVPEDIVRVLLACGFKGRSRVVPHGETDKGRGKNRRLYGFHSFRHAYASACANAGVPITTLAEILGDSIATLQKYYMHAQDEAREKIFAALKPAPAKRDVKAELVERIDAKLKDMKIPELRALLKTL